MSTIDTLPPALRASSTAREMANRLDRMKGQNRLLRGAVGSSASVRALAATGLGGGAAAALADAVLPRMSIGPVDAPRTGSALVVGLGGVWLESATMVDVGGGMLACAVRDAITNWRSTMQAKQESK